MFIEEDPPIAAVNLQKHRLLSLDVYRGLALAMLLLASVNREWQEAIAETYSKSWLAQFVGIQASHAPWSGCALWDLILPSFLFVAGAAITYSCHRRALFGQAYSAMFLHAAGRSLVLIFLGIFLRSNAAETTQWIFTDALTQIGLGYLFLFLLWDRGWKLQGLAALVILAVYWMRFAAEPIPGPDFDWSIAEGEGWTEPLTGFAAHWNKNANPGHSFDVGFLNGFPRAEPFVADPGGYQTLNFIPSLAVMIFGLMAGDFIRRCGRNWEVVKVFSAAGVAGLIAGIVLDASGLCPLVKRIFTPGFALYSTGWCLLILAGLYALIEMFGLQKLFRPFAVLGMNSIFVYVAIWLLSGWINNTLRTHLGQEYGAAFFGEAFQPLIENLVAGAVIWGIAWLMYRRKLFLRI